MVKSDATRRQDMSKFARSGGLKITKLQSFIFLLKYVMISLMTFFANREFCCNFKEFLNFGFYVNIAELIGLSLVIISMLAEDIEKKI